MSSGEPTRISAWLDRDEHDAARGAYLVAFGAGQADTFSQWATTAVLSFAQLDASERAGILERREHGGSPRSGSPRNVVVTPLAVEAMASAMREDREMGQWQSKSAWFATALAHATQATQFLSGRPLPTPPARLPFRRST